MPERHTDEPCTEDKKRGARPEFLQLIVCLLVLGIVLVFRAFSPDGTRAFLREHVSKGWEYTEVLAGVGQSLRAFFTDVPRPEDIAAVSLPSGSPAPSANRSASPTPATDGQIPKILPEEEYDPVNEPPPASPADGSPFDGIGGFGEPVVWLLEDLLPVDPELDVDDTLPIPFGFEKPERADYTVYELPFDTAMPAEGRFTSGFGYRVHPILGRWMFHYGVDIANFSGTAITAFADGRVADAGENDSYGKYLIVEHAGGFATVYAHCSKILVKIASC